MIDMKSNRAVTIVKHSLEDKAVLVPTLQSGEIPSLLLLSKVCLWRWDVQRKEEQWKGKELVLQKVLRQELGYVSQLSL